jgi:glycerophosphoryl diester phosphodiesterase
MLPPRQVRVCGHRGHSAGAPENTLAAFRMARELGGEGVTCETDLGLTKDNELILIHDSTVDRTTDGHGLVRNMTYADIAKLDAGRWFSEKYVGERVPRLREALRFARENAIILQLELKVFGCDHIIIPKLRDLIDELECADLLQFSSFDFVQLRDVKKAIPEVPTIGLCHSRLMDPVANAQAAQLDAVNIELKHFASGECAQLHEAAFAVFLAVLPDAMLDDLKAYGWDVESEVVEWVRRGYCDQIVSNDVAEMIRIRDKALAAAN